MSEQRSKKNGREKLTVGHLVRAFGGNAAFIEALNRQVQKHAGKNSPTLKFVNLDIIMNRGYIPAKWAWWVRNAMEESDIKAVKAITPEDLERAELIPLPYNR